MHLRSLNNIEHIIFMMISFFSAYDMMTSLLVCDFALGKASTILMDRSYTMLRIFHYKNNSNQMISLLRERVKRVRYWMSNYGSTIIILYLYKGLEGKGI